MCGIAGIAHWNNKDLTDTVTKMCDSIRHRGPDAAGALQLRGACLGHRRLSIIDLSEEAAQPMSDHSQRYWIVFNGEIYGFQKLKEALLKAGCRFKTKSDTEVILEGFKFWGIHNLCQRLNGMYAFALWDNEIEKLYLVRDRFGEKPLYYIQNSGEFRFGSFSKSLFIGAPKMDLNPNALLPYLQYGFCIPELPIFKDLKSVKPATYLEISKNSIKETPYWSANFEPKIAYSVEQWLEEIESRLTKVVAAELISDVGVGALLSGGVDSALIAATAVKLKPDLDLFTVKMVDNPKLDESEIARTMAKKIGGKHHIIDAKPIELEDFMVLQQQFSEPLGDSSAIGMWIVSKAARERVKVVLTGDGGDELFAGYDTVKMNLEFAKYRKLANNPLGKTVNTTLVKLLNKNSDKPFQRKLLTFSKIITQSIRENHLNHSHIPKKLNGTLWGNKLSGTQNATAHFQELSEKWNTVKAKEEIDKLMAFDLQFHLLGDYIPKVDTASMFHALEARTPFLHHNLADLAFKMPISIKRLNNTSKGILKALLVKKVGIETATKAIKGKRGFVLPIDKWLDGKWSDLVDELPNSDLVKEGYFSKKGINEVLSGYQKHPESYSRLRYSLVALNAWYRGIL